MMTCWNTYIITQTKQSIVWRCKLTLSVLLLLCWCLVNAFRVRYCLHVEHTIHGECRDLKNFITTSPSCEVLVPSRLSTRSICLMCTTMSEKSSPLRLTAVLTPSLISTVIDDVATASWTKLDYMRHWGKFLSEQQIVPMLVFWCVGLCNNATPWN